jgi:hypothetical protein
MALLIVWPKVTAANAIPVPMIANMIAYSAAEAPAQSLKIVRANHMAVSLMSGADRLRLPAPI